MRAPDVKAYIEEAMIAKETDSYWCRKISIPLLRFLVNHSKLDKSFSYIVALPSAAIAWKGPFPPSLKDTEFELLGQALAVVCNFIANCAIFLDFRLSDGVVRSIRAERELQKISPWLQTPILAAWYISTFSCLPGGMIAQAWLTGEGLPWGVSQLCLVLGGIGFLATRGAAFSRIILHFMPEIKPHYEHLSWIRRIAEYVLPIGSRTNLPWDEKVVDVLSTATTVGFMIGGRWIWVEMYRMKLIKGIDDIISVFGIPFDACTNNRCDDGPGYYLTAALSVLSFLYFYFPAQDALGHVYRFMKNFLRFFDKKRLPYVANAVLLILALALIGTCGAGSETGLVISRLKVPEFLAIVYFLMVNTPSLLKHFAECLQKKVNQLEFMVNTTSGRTDMQDLEGFPELDYFLEDDEELTPEEPNCFTRLWSKFSSPAPETRVEPINGVSKKLTSSTSNFWSSLKSRFCCKSSEETSHLVQASILGP
jgi:hypothetical protein